MLVLAASARSTEKATILNNGAFGGLQSDAIWSGYEGRKLNRGQLLHGDRGRTDARLEDRCKLADSRLKACVLVVGLVESGVALSFDALSLPRLRVAIIGLASPGGIGRQLPRDLLVGPHSSRVLTLS